MIDRKVIKVKVKCKFQLKNVIGRAFLIYFKLILRLINITTNILSNAAMAIEQFDTNQ